MLKNIRHISASCKWSSYNRIRFSSNRQNYHGLIKVSESHEKPSIAWLSTTLVMIKSSHINFCLIVSE